MLKSFEQKYVRKMARFYRKTWPEPTIHKAVSQAIMAYEIYREAEVEMMYEEQMKGSDNSI
jgi:hypothetical protein